MITVDRMVRRASTTFSLFKEVVEERARDIEVTDGCKREVLVFELLRHCTNDSVEVIVVLLRGEVESREEANNNKFTDASSLSLSLSSSSSSAIVYGSGKGGISSKVLVVIIIVPIGVSVLLFIIGFCFITRKAKKKYDSVEEDTTGNEISTTESLQYDLSKVQAATNNFSAENKIGEGGFGLVYMVRLHLISIMELNFLAFTAFQIRIQYFNGCPIYS
ncbi:Cysteine-rich receptor-like protein kinase 15 [Camellia lanceoleosa]|uniref:Cysteine-rich receptor-like protein kinase 15 n=1 Tax=Camellia lanceoleosa TaxID=1840588 RepID=A0ACC0GJ06_9ERIC|nr:Cysteine-rich receptor-like protein kinase 15 [Camellia lanceoleosa]